MKYFNHSRVRSHWFPVKLSNTSPLNFDWIRFKLSNTPSDHRFYISRYLNTVYFESLADATWFSLTYEHH